MPLNESAERVLALRYYHEGETWKTLCKRVSSCVAKSEKTPELQKYWETKFNNSISNLYIVPNSPTLKNAGTSNKMLAACFVLQPYDSKESIFNTLRDGVITQSMGGGCIDGNTPIYTQELGINLIKNIPEFSAITEFDTPVPITGYTTISYNQTMKCFESDNITHLWKFNVKQSDVRIIQFESGKIKTSAWHPFLVNKDGKIIEKRADELQPNDQVTTINPYHGLLKDSDSLFSWLLGYLIGDGNIGKTLTGDDRLRFFDQKTEILDRVNKVFSQYGTNVKMYKDPRENCYILTFSSSKNTEHGNTNQELRIFFNKVLSFFDEGKFILDKFKDIPSLSAFIAGVLDAEGYISTNKTSISMADKGFIYQLQKWIALMGVKSHIRERLPKRSKDKSIMYELTYATGWNRLFPTVKNSRLPKADCYAARLEIVKSVNIGECDEILYDFTVKTNNNYIAFNGNAFIVIHNTGFNFSTLRPRGEIVRQVGGKASGPVSFMKIYDLAIGETIRQGGLRAGAMMATFDYRHPDILNFITCKQTEQDLTHFNVSVLVTKEFFTAVADDKDIDLWFPDYKKYPAYNEEWDGDFDGWKEAGKPIKVYATVKAKEIWNKIIDNSWMNGEPGVIFKDIVNRDTPHPKGTVLISTNPCLHKDSILFDKNHLLSISEQSGTLWTSWKTGTKPCIKLTTNAGHEIVVTPDHKLMLEDGTFIEAKDSYKKKIAWGLGDWEVTKPISYENVLQGFLFGDGFLTGKKQGVSVKLTREKEREITLLLHQFGFKDEKCGNFYINKQDLPFNIDFLEKHTYDRILSDSYFKANKDLLRSFLIGLYEANGSVNFNSQISLKSTSKKLVQQIQIILSAFGIKSWINTNKSTLISWVNGDYTSKVSYNLQIAPRNAIKFKEKIGFLSYYKNNKIKSFCKPYQISLKVENIESVVEPQEVWDFKTTKHYNMSNGVVVHNCGEQALIDKGVCNLVSVNLTKFFNVTTKTFDFDKFKEQLEIALRFGDNSIDAADYGLDSINEVARSFRNVGVGLMGWADLLILMETRYDSDKALALIDDIGSFMMQVLNDYSIELGKEKGCAIGFSRRNMAVSSIQPTGTVSMIAGCSSGIEPNFDYITYRKDETGDHVVYNLIAEEYLKNNKVETLPDYFVKANDVPYLWHLKHLEYWQKYIENGISKTINLPNNATEKDIERALLYAHKTNVIKAFTVYRDGSRDLQVLNSEDTSKSNKNYVVPDTLLKERPDRYYGYTEKVPAANGNMYLTINKELSPEDYTTVREILQNRGRIVEVFGSFGKSGSDISGYINAICRLLSTSIRVYSADILELIDTIKGISFLPTWYKGKLSQSPVDAIAKALTRELDLREESMASSEKKEKKKPAENITSQVCSICGEEFKFQEGCKSCKCGSKCG